MATGLTEWSGAISPPDQRNQGEYESGLVAGIGPGHPLVGGPDVGGLGAYDVDRGRSRIATVPEMMGSASGSMAGQPGAELLDDWRDLFNFRGSPMPWLLLFVLAALGMMQFRLNARVGPGRANLELG